MSRLACLRLKQLPLQLLLRERPEWAHSPVAVVKEESARAPLLFCNQRAHHGGARVGMRYGAALTLLPTLRAQAISQTQVQRAHRSLLSLLGAFSPTVEASSTHKDTFWLDCVGIEQPLKQWAAALHQALNAQQLSAALSVGFCRFASWVNAREHQKSVIFHSIIAEQKHSHSAPLCALSLSARLLQSLDQLGVHTVGAFLALPQSAVLQRFGPVALSWHSLGNRPHARPLRPTHVREPLQITLDFDEPIAQSPRLFAQLQHQLHLHPRFQCPSGESITALSLRLQHERSSHHRPPDRILRVQPSVPATRPQRLLELLQRRLNVTPLKGRVHRAVVQLISQQCDVEQAHLIGVGAQRDAHAAARALDQLRASLGDEAVYTCALHDRPLPEQQFSPVPFVSLRQAAPSTPPRQQAVRRIYQCPARATAPPDWRAHFTLSGGWWCQAYRRAYGTDSNRGWCFTDLNSGAHFAQGALE